MPVAATAAGRFDARMPIDPRNRESFTRNSRRELAVEREFRVCRLSVFRGIFGRGLPLAKPQAATDGFGVHWQG
jgi:hypothetical protein